MKKIVLAGGIAIVLGFFPFAAGAQTITRAEVQQIVPDLSNAMTILSSKTEYIRLRMETENKLFTAYSHLLGAWSTRISQTGLSAQEAQDLRGSLENMNEQLAVSASWRSETTARIGAITNILGSITSLIASAS